MKNAHWNLSLFSLLAILLGLSCSSPTQGVVTLEANDHILLVGNNLCSRMQLFGYFETELQMRNPELQLYVRNICDGGNTPGFRPHSGRNNPWAYPGAHQFHDELATNSGSTGHFETDDEWLGRHQADIILAFFGYNESFSGPAGVENFKGELAGFIDHTLSTLYNGDSVPELVIVSPIAFEDLSEQSDLPNGIEINNNLTVYTEAMRQVCQEKQVDFVDAFSISKSWYSRGQHTIDGLQLTEKGYEKFSKWLVNSVFGSGSGRSNSTKEEIRELVLDKNWFWLNDFKIPNGVHVFGRRYNPFGPENYPYEIQKVREMTHVRDTAIWKAIAGEEFDIAAADAKTIQLPPVESNFTPSEDKPSSYLYGQDAIDQLETAPGYKIELFASEKEFPDLANPVQLSFDNAGRLWVATMPTYPHYKPGDAKPNDKLIILEDTDNDGKADNQIIFADGLHLPLGFEFAPEGVYLSQGTDFLLLIDHDGDDRADERKVLLSGFDDHDTHHAHSAYCADPSGAIYMGEGVFLHTNVETPYGTVRATNGGFYRYSPQRQHLERTAQLSIPNPWGIAFDEWGQYFFAETSGPDVRWMMPGSVKSRYGEATHKSYNLIEDAHRVRPTSGLEFVSSRHFPEEVQGDLLINNTIGYLGTKMHQMIDDSTGYESRHRLDLVVGSDPNFRPVDLEFAPDGSLYLVDWHNILVGHMQHNARDPYRDHVHGRIFRITYPARPLVQPAKIVGASIRELLDNLKLPEYRTRYRTRRELRGRNADEVLDELLTWYSELDKDDPNYDHHVLEALWVSWGLNQIHRDLLLANLNSSDFKARAAAVQVLRYGAHQIDDQAELLLQAAKDEHGRVRLAAIVAASWLPEELGMPILNEAAKHPLDRWMIHAHETAVAHIQGKSVKKETETVIAPWYLKGDHAAAYLQGKEIYEREGYCITCHQEKGEGLALSGFPPLTNTQWAVGNPDRLIKMTLHGVMGPMTVLGKEYAGAVPMTPFGGLLNDEELAAVLTYVRNSFGNRASIISSQQVKRVRAETSDHQGFYSAEQLLAEHPFEDSDGRLVN